MKKNPFFLIAAVAGLIWYFFFNKKTQSPTLQPLPTGGVKTISAYVPKIQTANMIASPIGLLDLNNAGGTDRLGNLAPASASGSKSCGCGC